MNLQNTSFEDGTEPLKNPPTRITQIYGYNFRKITAHHPSNIYQKITSKVSRFKSNKKQRY